MSRPPDVEPPGGSGQALRDHETKDATIVAQPAEAAKQFSTLRAIAALRGYTLKVANDGDGTAYEVGRWNLSKRLPSLASVGRWLEQVGGAS